MTSERNFDDIYFKLSTRIICSTENYTLRLTVEKRFKTRKSNISNNHVNDVLNISFDMFS